MIFPLHHLRRQIIQCPTKCSPSRRRGMDTPSEIGDFDFTADGDENVFGFDVSVDDVFFVEVGGSVGHLVDIGGGGGVAEFSLFAEEFVQFPRAGEFQYQKRTSCIVKMAVQSKNI